MPPNIFMYVGFVYICGHCKAKLPGPHTRRVTRWTIHTTAATAHTQCSSYVWKQQWYSTTVWWKCRTESCRESYPDNSWNFQQVCKERLWYSTQLLSMGAHGRWLFVDRLCFSFVQFLLTVFLVVDFCWLVLLFHLPVDFLLTWNFEDWHYHWLFVDFFNTSQPTCLCYMFRYTEKTTKAPIHTLPPVWTFMHRHSQAVWEFANRYE